MINFYKREHDSLLKDPSPIPSVCCLSGYSVILSEKFFLTSQEKRRDISRVSMPVRGIIVVPNQVAAGLCTVLIWVLQVVIHGFL